ncbi:MAG: putative rane protein [Subtercola sp.]|nr:putative rane protein [Subtercola sp.]
MNASTEELGDAATATAAAHRTECWLRRQGLPHFVAAPARRALLFARITPFLVLVMALHAAGWLLGRTDVTVDNDDALASLAVALLAAGAAAALIATPTVAFVFTARLLRAHPRFMRLAGACVTTYFLLIDPWLAGPPAPTDAVRLPLAASAVDLFVVGGALLTTWAGVGCLAAWAVRTSIRRLRALGEMSTRALPLLMLVVFFSFFAPAIWAVTNTMSVGRLLAVVAFFVLLGLLFIVPITRSELHGVDDRIGVDERADLVAGTELARLLTVSAAAGPPLSRLERANLQAVLLLAQGAQVAVFAALIAAFLIGLGEVALSPTVLASWLGSQAPQLELFGVATGIDIALVKTAVFLSCVSSLNFLVSATSNAAYKSAFYDPLFDEARVALAVRSAYVAIRPC